MQTFQKIDPLVMTSVCCNAKLEQAHFFRVQSGKITVFGLGPDFLFTTSILAHFGESPLKSN